MTSAHFLRSATISYAIFLLAGVPATLVDRLDAAIDATIRSPEVSRKLAELAADPQFGTPSDFKRYVSDDLAKRTRLAKDAGLKVE